MITFILNDKKITTPENTNLKSILAEHGYTDAGFATALNNRFIPRSHHEKTILSDGDRLEIITPMQGG